MANKVVKMDTSGALPPDVQDLLLEMIKIDGERKSMRKREKQLKERESEIFRLTRPHFGKKKTRTFVIHNFIFSIKKTGKTSVGYKELSEFAAEVFAKVNKKLYEEFMAKKEELTTVGETKEAIAYTELKKVDCVNC